LVEEIIKKSVLADIKLSPPPALESLSTAVLFIPAETCFLEIVGDFVRRCAMLAGHSNKVARLIELAIDEIASNAIIHGYKCDPNGIIKIETFSTKDSIVIALEEKGTKFNPLETISPDIDAPLSARKIGGLGLYIVRKIADELYYEELADMTKRFTFVKKISKKRA
jgi:serine/threonine-protein kinase RsbW